MGGAGGSEVENEGVNQREQVDNEEMETNTMVAERGTAPGGRRRAPFSQPPRGKCASAAGVGGSWDAWTSPSPPPLGVAPAAGLAMERAAHGGSEQPARGNANASRSSSCSLGDSHLSPAVVSCFRHSPPPPKTAQGKFRRNTLIFKTFHQLTLK